MRFETIRIDGFGCLRDISFNLSPGLNVFYGANEAGKSTLQQAIWALLYGFYKGDRKSAQESELLNRYRPWSGGTYAGYLVFRLDSRKAFRVVRSFDDHDLRTSVWEADTGRDITNNFERGKLGRVAFAHEHFGMSEDVFVNTCFVRQADLHHLADAAQEITETIINLAGTGSQNRSVKRAQELLAEAFQEQVGSARAKTKPLPIALQKLENLRKEKQHILARRSALETDYERRAQLLTEKERLSQEATRLQYLLAVTLRDQLASRIDEVQMRLSRISEQEDRLASLRDVVDFPVSQRDLVQRLFQDWVNYRDRFTKMTHQMEASLAKVAELRHKRQALVEEKRPLETARDIPLDQEPTIRELEQRWRDEVKAVQRTDEVLKQAQTSVNEMETVRELARQHATIVEIGPQALHDLKLRWEVAESDVVAAMREVEAAEQAWQTQPLSVQSYEQLQGRFGEFSFETLSAFKEQAASLTHLQKQTAFGLKPVIGWALLVIGSLTTIGGVAALLLGLSRRVQALTNGGISALVLGMGLVTTALINLRRGEKLKEKVQESSKHLSEDLERIGYETVEELEKSYYAYLEAQAPYDHLARVREALADKRAVLEKIESEGRSFLGLEPEAVLTLATLMAAEQKAQGIADQVKELNRREQQRDQLNHGLNQTTEALARAETQLRAALQMSNFEGGDLSRDVGRFYELCTNRRRLEKLEAEQQALDARLELHVTKETEAKGAAIALEAAQKQLQRVLRQIGINEDEPEQAFRMFETRCEQAETLRQLRGELGVLAREVQAIQGGQSLEQLRRHHETWSREALALLAADPSHKGLTTNEQPETLQRKLDEVRQKLADMAPELAATEERIGLAWSGLRSLAEVEEELLTTQETIAVLEFHGQALELAREQLAAAADEHHRNFLPRLNQIVGNNLSQVTGGRYANVQIDHADLQIRLQVPDLPHPVIPEVLSRGAQEQIYLLLRLGLTELMSSGRERLPLMLDDPLVNYDQDRLLRGLDFLAELAQQTQVLLFTRDWETVRWFRSEHENSGMHKLHEL